MEIEFSFKIAWLISGSLIMIDQDRKLYKNCTMCLIHHEERESAKDVATFGLISSSVELPRLRRMVP